MALDSKFYSKKGILWVKIVQSLCLCIINHGTSNIKILFYNLKNKWEDSCRQLNKILLFCTKTQNMLSLYIVFSFYYILLNLHCTRLSYTNTFVQVRTLS